MVQVDNIIVDYPEKGIIGEPFQNSVSNQGKEDEVVVEEETSPSPEEAPFISLLENPPDWIRTGGPLGGLGYDVRMHPDNPDLMYVTDAYAGVFISEDGGLTWQPSNEGITDRSGESQDAIPVFCLTIDPHNPDIIWSGTQYSGGIFEIHGWRQKLVAKNQRYYLKEWAYIQGYHHRSSKPGYHLCSWRALQLALVWSR